MSIHLNSKSYKGWVQKVKNVLLKLKIKLFINKRFSLGVSIVINSNIDFTIKEKHLIVLNLTNLLKKNISIKLWNNTK